MLCQFTQSGDSRRFFPKGGPAAPIPGMKGATPGPLPLTLHTGSYGVNLEALILAELGGSRLRPLTDHLPLSVVPVGGTPILDHEIQALRGAGVDSIVVVGGYRAAQVEQICRVYDGVRFRRNPAFSREEPTLSALRAAGTLSGRPLLLVRGDLVFDVPLLERVLKGSEANRVAVDGEGRPIGLWRLTPRVVEVLRGAAGLGGPGDEVEPPLGEILDVALAEAGAETVPVDDLPWARVATMEDLARALVAHRRAAEDRVSRNEQRLRRARPAPEPERVEPRLPVRPMAPSPVVRPPWAGPAYKTAPF